jgi:TPR repeat protein
MSVKRRAIRYACILSILASPSVATNDLLSSVSPAFREQIQEELQKAPNPFLAYVLETAPCGRRDDAGFKPCHEKLVNAWKKEGDRASAQTFINLFYSSIDDKNKAESNKYLNAAIGKWKQAASAGDVTAQYSLCKVYQLPEPIFKRDYAQALEFCTQAADQGLAHAQNELGILYSGVLQGTPGIDVSGLSGDEKKSVYWYRKAAEQGYAPAQTSLGSKFFYGKGVPNDYAEAVYWFTKAAEQGEADAMQNLGAIYLHGRGTPVDLVKAYMWYNIGASFDGMNKALSAFRSEVENKMTPEQVAKAQKLTREWLAARPELAKMI